MHPKGDLECEVKENRQKPIDVRLRVSIELHEGLKAHAKKEERSMNYLIRVC